MESVENLIKLITPSERKVLPLLKQTKDINYLIKLSDLNEPQVNRALSWLKDKHLKRILEDEKKIVKCLS